jgi:hypothetical protein
MVKMRKSISTNINDSVDSSPTGSGGSCGPLIQQVLVGFIFAAEYLSTLLESKTLFKQ